FGGTQGWRWLALDGTMIERARSREANRACAHRFRAQAAHLRDVVFRRRFEFGAAFTHDIDAQGAMRKLRTDVDIALAGFERVEIVPETFPVPAQAFVQGDAGNVFDAFHQFDQAVAVGPADRREADPAVSHHHRGHAVPARWRK